MSPERLRQIEELYHSACERRVDERDAFLQQACGDDLDLLRQARALVAQDVVSGPMEKPVLQVAARLLSDGAKELASGTMLGPYRVERRLGEGGMGDVYKARDTRLGRDVAIKTAKQEFSGRFQREARAISALNHPHICTLYDVGTDYLVMEYIEGTPIHGPMPVAEALRLGRQIAAAVRHAHQHGVIHRDLKPGNILVNKSGVKVLDFGLAKLAHAGDGGGEITATHSLTEQGAILGTLRYMAPEQLKGEEADPRSDVFALGVVLYEVLTGRPAFEADSQAEVIASLLKAEAAPVSKLAPQVPPALDHLIQTCLAKNPEDRRQTMQDVLTDLEWIASGGAERSAAPATHKRLPNLGWAVAALSAAAAVALAWVHFRETPPEAPLGRFEIPLPPDVAWWERPAISPDGNRFVFSGVQTNGKRMLWVRRLDSAEMTPLPGTEGGDQPFWSADSRYIGFRDGATLRKIDANGGPPQTIDSAPADSFWSEASWNESDVILLGRGAGAICQVSAAGGEARPVLNLDAARKERSQVAPRFLPDGRHFVYVSRTDDGIGVHLASLDGGKPHELLPNASDASFVAPGFLLFVRGNSLLGQRFDPGRLRLQGEPFIVLDSLGRLNGGSVLGFYSASRSGALLYRPGYSADLQLTSADRSGKRTKLGEPRRYYQGSLSPDERRMAIQINDPMTATDDIWVLDLPTGILSRVTREPGVATTPQWSPDGRELLFSSNRDGHFVLYRKVVGATTEQAVLPSMTDIYPSQWLQDGSLLLLDGFGRSFFRLGAGVGAKMETPLATEYRKDGARVSLDGRWVVYNAEESGRWEIYVAAFPSFTQRRQVSNNGGVQGFWRGDGKELFYLALDGTITSVQVKTEGGLETGLPRPLFRSRIPVNALWDQYAVTRDGQRFLMFETPESVARTLSLVLNWPALLRK